MHDRMKKMKAVWFSALAAALVAAGCAGKDEESLEELSVSAESETEKEGAVPQEEQEPAETVYVYVCGAVNAPGVYELKKDARVFEAITLAGGMTAEAAPEAVSQARTVADGEQIYVPTVREVQMQGSGVEDIVTGNADVSGKININTAGKEELMTLTGIGEAKAQSILDYREEHGQFGSIEDLMLIEGIKEGVFNKIKEDITI
ncbi:MAG TPA: ComEA family DNA-binding protein [Candidatus Mediterraneibacter tabaqchaliae]|uniref:ComEA family DNA-binding protein n=1 Tax=Candidatus Mediterraneibacter tabaqchaliae TaxID=2838689 RepID=A0A9D2R2W8_9FIRM|nr:ComEA family DNA-binding protein [Candidatus Mediterraneibacter tabaqchaliae]